MRRNQVRYCWGALAAGFALGCPSPALMSNSSAALQLANGDRLLAAGRYQEAQAAYSGAERAAAGDRSTRASALFGKAIAWQQASATGSEGAGSNDSVLAAYGAARGLDPDRLFGPASNNAGLVLRAGSQHQEALRYFLDAAGTNHRARAYFYLNAGGEYDQLGQLDNAAGMYRRALEIDPGYLEARQALLALYLRRSSPDSLLSVARKWGADPGSAGPVNDAILAFLLKPGESPGRAYGDSLLLALAGNFASSGLSPARFNAAYVERLADIQRRHPGLAEPIAVLRDAYRERRPSELYVEPPVATWWRRRDPQGGPRAVWSRCLRVLGDRYNQAGDTDVAASYYEAAVGYPNNYLLQPWVDLEALLPLGVIYVARVGGQAEDPNAVRHLNELIDGLFMGKGAAYQAGDLPRIRSFHITLGKMYADRGQWGDMYNSRSAVFQLERMQMTTRLMREKGDTAAFDPPQLLETLAKGYFGTHRAAEGRRTALAAAATYGRLGRVADSTAAMRLAENR